MKKTLSLWLLAHVFVLFLASAALAAPEVKALAPGVFAFIGGEGKTNSGFVVTDAGVIIIDTQGPPGLAKLLREKIKEITDKPVTHVVNTHYHGDHTFGNQYFGEGLIISHENTRKALLERDSEHRAMFRRFFGEDSLSEFRLTLPEATFTERMILRHGGKTVELISAGEKAHTDGDIYVWLPEERVLFAGDLLYSGRLPLLSDGESEGALAAVDRILSMKAAIYLPGHGPVSGEKEAAQYRGYLEALRAEVGKMKGEGMSREEVVSKISLPAYSSWIMYRQWIGANAAKVYDELSAKGDKGD